MSSYAWRAHERRAHVRAALMSALPAWYLRHHLIWCMNDLGQAGVQNDRTCDAILMVERVVPVMRRLHSEAIALWLSLKVEIAEGRSATRVVNSYTTEQRSARCRSIPHCSDHSSRLRPLRQSAQLRPPPRGVGQRGDFSCAPPWQLSFFSALPDHLRRNAQRPSTFTRASAGTSVTSSGKNPMAPATTTTVNKQAVTKESRR